MLKSLTLRGTALALVAAASIMAFAEDADATTINRTIEIESVDYIFFDHFGGALDIAVSSNDPLIRLFQDNGSSVGALTGAQIDFNDDVGPFHPTLSPTDSLLSFASLGSGAYVLAVGLFPMSEAEARSGVASTPTQSTGPQAYTAVFSPDVEVRMSPVPLPAGLPLLLAGLGGLAILRRKSA